MERMVVKKGNATPTAQRNPDSIPTSGAEGYDPAFVAFKAQKIQAVSATSSISTSLGTYKPKAAISWSSTASPYRNIRPSFDALTAPYPQRPINVPRPPTFYTVLDSRSKGLSEGFFKQLPPAVYNCILRQLQIIHTVPSSKSCHSCYVRDLCSLSLTSKAWNREVVKCLYSKIAFAEYGVKQRIKRLKVKLKQLRRTLRARASLSHYVRELHVYLSQMAISSGSSALTNLVASLVMSCPNLEHFGGYHQPYNHEFDRLTHALSTRKRLKAHLWLIGENDAVAQRALRQLAPGLMDIEQKFSFASFHNGWPLLTTLLLHAPDHGILERDLFVNTKSSDPRKLHGPGILHRLPSLQHLCVSNFDVDDFDDQTLQHLPALRSLRLQDLEGVTFWGLSEFSRTRNAFELRKLAIVNVDVLYMSAISSLLLRLKNLKKFTLVQDSSPEIPAEEVVIQPIIASPQLEYLHWDILLPGSANANLADSVRAGAFPRLQTIRVPSDHGGLLQTLCKPRSQIMLPGDWSLEATASGAGLRAARQAAQQRLEKAWTTIQYKVIVEEGNVIKEVYDISGFMGTVGSKIEYSLDPDLEGSDRALVDFEDLTAKPSGIEAEAERCTGSWNARHPAGAKWWAHEDRPWQVQVDLLKFF